jgi:hypothetical protein
MSFIRQQLSIKLETIDGEVYRLFLSCVLPCCQINHSSPRVSAFLFAGLGFGIHPDGHQPSRTLNNCCASLPISYTRRARGPGLAANSQVSAVASSPAPRGAGARPARGRRDPAAGAVILAAVSPETRAVGPDSAWQCRILHVADPTQLGLSPG